MTYPTTAAIYQRASELCRAMVAATTIANNPDLAYPDTTPPPDLGRREVRAEITYYEFLAAHRSELGARPEFGVEYGVLDSLAAENLTLTDLFTSTGDPEERDRDRRRNRLPQHQDAK
ncbi:hypothetical protein [Nocardia sp. NPDC057030]|uniref:hypothetical protein n=1 Tax=unclassified Nocardia TaxID=2637762 RepID=UPI00362713D3